MVHQYLKTCVLSACVAALCGGRAFGRVFPCLICGKDFFREDALRQHMKDRKHRDPKALYKYFCDGCRKCIPVGGLTAHLQEEHTTEMQKQDRKIVCMICSRIYRKEIFLKESEWGGHFSKEHKKSPDFNRVWCQRCHKFMEEGYEKHILKHPGQCLFCDTNFNENERATHMEQKHKIACYFCKEEISVVSIFGHFSEKHSVIKGPCNVVKNSQEEGKEGASVREMCKDWVECSVLAYLSHLKLHHGGSHVDCLLCGLPIPDPMIAAHFSDFHKGWFIDCAECKALRSKIGNDCFKNGYWVLAEGHSESFHNGKKWFLCVRCVKNIYEEETHDNENVKEENHDNEDFQKRHFLSEHKEYLKICSICKEKVLKRNSVPHLLKEHSDRFGECNLCGAYERPKEEKKISSALAEKEFHAGKVHPGYSVCKKCGLLVLASNMNDHKGNFHPESKILCYHGSMFDFEREENEHLKKHSTKCWKCGKTDENGVFTAKQVKIGHIPHEHRCGKNCRPIMTTEKVWEWQCADDCPNRGFKCRLENCTFIGDKESLKKHTKTTHGCSDYCGFVRGTEEKHHFRCKAFRFLQCPICKKRDVDLKHIIQKHRCNENCSVGKYLDRTLWAHDGECPHNGSVHWFDEF